MINIREDAIKNGDAEVWAFRRVKADAARDLVDLSERAILENCYKASRAYRFASLFEGFILTNLSSWGADVTASDKIFPGLDAPVIKNRCRSLCQTFVAKSFANDSPLPQFTTKGGDFDQINAAEDLDDAICSEYAQPHGQFSDIHEMHRHGGLIATSSTGQYGIFAIYYDNSIRPEAELDDTLTLGIYRAYRYGPIRHMVRTVWMLPEEAIRKFGQKFSKKIYENLESREGPFMAGQGVASGQATGEKAHTLRRREVRVVMGWHVKVGDEMGREMFCLKDQTILRDNQKYDKPEPPCVLWQYDIELGGEGGTPLTQIIYNLSRYQNRILNDVDTSERNTSQVIVAVQKGTQGQKAAKSEFAKSKAVHVVEIDGPVEGAFKIMDMPKFAKDSLALEAVYDQAQFDDTRIGRNHAQGTGQSGTTSGLHESLRASYYTESFADAERRSINVRAIGTARIFFWVLQRLADSGFERWVGDKESRRLIRSADLDLEDDKYILEIKAVSEGKDTPKSRIEKAEKWLKDPSIPFEGSQMVQMYQSYDTDAFAEKVYGIDAWTEEQVKRYRKSTAQDMSRADFYQPPERWMQLEALKSSLLIMTLAFLQARQTKMPSARTRWFEKFANDCVTLIHEEEARIAALQNPQPMAPPGAQMPMAA